MRNRDPSLPPLIELKKGRIYKLNSRNLSYAVFDGNTGFIGIREKFGSRFLDMEHHWDIGAHGTVSGLADREVDIPSDIEINLESEKLFDFINNIGNKLLVLDQ